MRDRSTVIEISSPRVEIESRRGETARPKERMGERWLGEPAGSKSAEAEKRMKWRSTNGGRTWLNVHSNLPTTAAPATRYSLGAISINPADRAVLYTTFTFEEARSGNRGASWSN
jgi:hypothetical protein